jgi:hypothetical protein
LKEKTFKGLRATSLSIVGLVVFSLQLFAAHNVKFEYNINDKEIRSGVKEKLKDLFLRNRDLNYHSEYATRKRFDVMVKYPVEVDTKKMNFLVLVDDNENNTSRYMLISHKKQKLVGFEKKKIADSFADKLYNQLLIETALKVGSGLSENKFLNKLTISLEDEAFVQKNSPANRKLEIAITETKKASNQSKLEKIYSKYVAPKRYKPTGTASTYLKDLSSELTPELFHDLFGRDLSVVMQIAIEEEFQGLQDVISEDMKHLMSPNVAEKHERTIAKIVYFQNSLEALSDYGRLSTLESWRTILRMKLMQAHMLNVKKQIKWNAKLGLITQYDSNVNIIPDVDRIGLSTDKEDFNIMLLGGFGLSKLIDSQYVFTLQNQLITNKQGDVTDNDVLILQSEPSLAFKVSDINLNLSYRFRSFSKKKIPFETDQGMKRLYNSHRLKAVSRFPTVKLNWSFLKSTQSNAKIDYNIYEYASSPARDANEINIELKQKFSLRTKDRHDVYIALESSFYDSENSTDFDYTKILVSHEHDFARFALSETLFYRIKDADTFDEDWLKFSVKGSFNLYKQANSFVSLSFATKDVKTTTTSKDADQFQLTWGIFWRI